MKINFKEILEHIKEFWKKLSEKSKKLFWYRFFHGTPNPNTGLFFPA